MPLWKKRSHSEDSREEANSGASRADASATGEPPIVTPTNPPVGYPGSSIA